ncbi:MAG: response regulator transcription factor [Candidatus Acidiferrales bacterium]
MLADDHDTVREGLKALFKRHSQWIVCGEAKNGQEAVNIVAELQPELVVLDLSMPVMNGIHAAAKIRQIAPNTKIVMLSMHTSSYSAEEAFRVGVNVYLTKSEAGAELMRTVDALFGG